MAELKYDPVKHDHMAFLDEASKHRGFRKAYDALEVEYARAHEMLTACHGYPVFIHHHMSSVCVYRDECNDNPPQHEHRFWLKHGRLG